MAITHTLETQLEATGEPATAPSESQRPRPPRDLQKTFRLVLATIWLLDAVLQLQAFEFTRGARGFSGMLHGVAAGNPGWIARTITWNASIVDHQPILTNAAFAGIQFLIAFGIIYRRTVRPALALSVVWAIGVWWFGEGLGGVLTGAATPFGGGPGAVLFYALLAVLLWPREGSDRPFVAARAVGVRAAKALWAVVWALLAVLFVVGAGRSPAALGDLVAADLSRRQPGWLDAVDRTTESLLVHHGATMAVLLAIVCLAVGAAAFASPRAMRLAVVVAIAVSGLIWIAVQNFGGILAGGATDPNAGLPLIVIAAAYWPLASTTAPSRPQLLGAPAADTIDPHRH